MTVKELDKLQKVLTKQVKDSIKHYDFDSAINVLKHIKKLDLHRRTLWHNEKFGVYEKIADECIRDFSSDDIPF